MRDIDRQTRLDASDPASSFLEEVVVVPLIEESLVVGKRTIDQGGYRVVKTVDTRDEVVDEPLVAHSVHVERRAIGRLLASMEVPASRQEGDTLIVSVVEEVLVTEKRLMLKEELHITRTEAITHRPVTWSLRSENVVVERLEPSGPAPTPEAP